tara:strand:+ start:478 stop:1983 length:1506 start_codon:yes stop_codon:yes gene_type:complete
MAFNFRDVLSELIIEGSRYDIFMTKYTKPKKKGKKAMMSTEQLKAIMLADPTTVPGDDVDIDTGEINKVGKYTQWIIKQFMGLQQEADKAYAYGSPDWGVKLELLQKQFFEDLYKVTDNLLMLDRLKTMKKYKGEKDINKIKSLDLLFDEVKDYNISKDELTMSKAERQELEIHPGSTLVFEGDKWQVIKIEQKNPLGKEAACYYGGQNKETQWCTSAPGLNYYENTYIPKGPLYVILDKTDTEVSKPRGSGVENHKQTGLPKNRYQFHFETNNFMDIDDRSVDIVEMLSGTMTELKEFFKEKFMTDNDKMTEQVSLKYPQGGALGKFVALYGFVEFFNTLPDNLQHLDITIKTGTGYGQVKADSSILAGFKIPTSISRFKQLKVLHISGILKELPPEVCQCKSLDFISIPENPNLKDLPDCISTLDITALNVTGDKNLIIPLPIMENVWCGKPFIVGGEFETYSLNGCKDEPFVVGYLDGRGDYKTQKEAEAALGETEEN